MGEGKILCSVCPACFRYRQGRSNCEHAVLLCLSTLHSNHSEKFFCTGTFGRVLECWDRKNKDYVAIKIVRNVQKYRDAAMIEVCIYLTTVICAHNAASSRCSLIPVVWTCSVRVALQCSWRF